jgi:hypothetical protein
VRLSYTANPNRAENVLVEVQCGDQDKTLRINQRKTPPIDEVFISLGRFQLSKGADFSVEISNAEATGHVIADAVQLLPKR